MKHKKFSEVLPYTYEITYLPTGEKYHGARYRNINENRSPIDDLGTYYAGSSVSKKEIFTTKAYRQTPQEYKFKFQWTFDTINELEDYEAKVNKRLIERTRKVDSGLITGSVYVNACYGKAIAHTDEVRRKISDYHNSHCSCGCGLSRAKCSSIKAVKTRNSDACTCSKILECDGSLTTYECAGIRCSDREHYTIQHYKTKDIKIGTRHQLAELVGADASHIGMLVNSTCRSVKGYCLFGSDISSVRTLNEIKTISHKTLGTMTGTINELADKVGADAGQLGTLFRDNNNKILTAKGWYNPEKNPDGLGGFGTGALKNRWWKNNKIQTSHSLLVWRDIKDIHNFWVNSGKVGYTQLTSMINTAGYTIGRSPVENFIKMFNDAEQFEEMSLEHSDVNFDSLIRSKLSGSECFDFSKRSLKLVNSKYKSLSIEQEHEVCELYKTGCGNGELVIKFNVDRSTILGILKRYNIKIVTDRRWWKIVSIQTVDSLTVWKDIETVHDMWNGCSGTVLLNKLSAAGYNTSKKRCENFVKLFKDTEQYQEMLNEHGSVDFNILIEARKPITC